MTPTPIPCVGDCDGKGTVTVDELVKGVTIALGEASIEECPSFDLDHSNTVTVDELVRAVTNALDGCQNEVVDELHAGIAVPGDTFALLHSHADPASVVVYLKSPLPPFELVLLAENANYELVPTQDMLGIRVFALPSQFVIPGTYDFLVSYSFAPIS